MDAVGHPDRYIVQCQGHIKLIYTGGLVALYPDQTWIALSRAISTTDETDFQMVKEEMTFRQIGEMQNHNSLLTFRHFSTSQYNKICKYKHS